MLRRRPRHGDDPAADLRAPPGADAKLRIPADFGEADQYLRGQDPVLRRLIDEGGPIAPEIDRRASRPDPYRALSRAIVGQQLSTKAAATIWSRFEEAFGGSAKAVEVAGADDETLRAAGLSGSKTAYLKDLASRVASGALDLDRLGELSDEDVIAELIEIKGIGRWTAEMFLIFHLGRPDVISAGDLGIRRAVQIAYELDELPGPTELERLAESWRPQRTLACLYLWRSLDNVPA